MLDVERYEMMPNNRIVDWYRGDPGVIWSALRLIVVCGLKVATQPLMSIANYFRKNCCRYGTMDWEVWGPDSWRGGLVILLH